ncbi:tryptophan--tRNA ligase [Sporomusa acidovorans]|uniref:Tryptophan--tRNA ligase n=1 Tax=Sporomusa acidovorans (strain ATCC 49682 / DSM 3132 / Mol) TaxID=1123286 RepID=A0ABZ3J374_SPOA4|nr:tryptophan--tRNA ligase [Sporomusa acidovorans]OZC20327.1 tryptophan--tRNA ligase [Sporomusa acidovorans DSM 3132]SDD37434.1 tryptophanyl-tRNA synthetase [Sporomusa acidovorans]
MAKKRIFSGMQPSGRFHMGNYQVLTNWIKLQEEYDCIFSIVDWHSLTSSYEDTSKLPERIETMALDWLSAGLDPEKNIIFVQSHVKEHAELHLLLSMMTPLSWLERVPTYKDKLQQLGEMGKEINTYGFLGYPELMTADIILYKANVVPVAEDQLPHLELSREIIRRFANLYKPVFPEPQPILSPLLPGIDGRKMSKSYGNEIPYAAEPDEISARVRLMVTDPQRVKKTDPGNPDICTVYTFHKIFSPEHNEITGHCRNASIGCVECKKRLAEKMIMTLADVHGRRREMAKNPEKIKELLAYGAERARKIAATTMEEVRSVMNLG